VIETGGRRAAAFLAPFLIVLTALSPATARADPASVITANHKGPQALSLDEMDRVTAGGLALRFDLASAARGGLASATATAQAQIARANLLKVAPVAGAPARAGLRLQGEVPAAIGLGTGEAIASGDGAKSCTARADALGNIAFLHSLVMTATTPSSVTCLCSIFAIAPLR
jgi:hypothetical protein